MAKQFTFFYGGSFSQHSKCSFTVNGTKYNSSLQYMYHQKAKLFKREDIAAKIIETENPRDFQRIFDTSDPTKSNRDLWESSCAEILFKGNSEKFEQDERLQQQLLETAGTTLVYTDSKDMLLGIGLSEKDEGRFKKEKWRGKNILGNVLTEIRDNILKSLEWSVGSKCKARWSNDSKWYPASIVSMHPDRRSCTVKYDRYDNEEIQQLLHLIPASMGHGTDKGGKNKSHRDGQKRALKKQDDDEDWDKDSGSPAKMRTGVDITQQRSKFTFFFGGQDILSQWYITRFQVDGVWYNCAEQYMMHQKALLFNDHEMADEIMKAKRPVHQKQLGRSVRGYNDKKWDSLCKDIVKKGNMSKFSQNADLYKYLVSTADTILVEASPYDKKWGIGLAADDHNAPYPDRWLGENLLGQVLMEVRQELLERGDVCFESNETAVAEAEEGYTLFWRSHSPFSQWYPAKFVIDDVEYNCAEQYMMYQKAVYFEDYNAAQQILGEKEPRIQKQIARKVRGFDESRWNEVSKAVVRRGSFGKYSQNPHLRQELFATANTVLVEASLDDTRWGIGSTKDDRSSWNCKTWRGENWLGQILTDIRNELMEMKWDDMDRSRRMLRNDEGISFRAFSLPQSPFHLFYPANINVGGNRFYSAGHLLVYKLAASMGSQELAEQSRQLQDCKPLVQYLRQFMEGHDQWTQELNEYLLSCNRIKFEQNENLMDKLLDSAPDQLVYAGSERHLGINYQLKISGYSSHENRLGQALMFIREGQLIRSDARVKFSYRHHEPRSVNVSIKPNRDDHWGGATTPRSALRESSRDETRRDRKGSRVQRGRGEDAYFSKPAERSSHRSRSNDRSPANPSVTSPTPTPPSGSTFSSTPRTNKQQAQSDDFVFSGSDSPFYLWYPAPIEFEGQTYKSAGQCLLHIVASNVDKDTGDARSMLEKFDETYYHKFVVKPGNRFRKNEFTDYIQDNDLLKTLNNMKFEQNEQLLQILLATGEAKIVYASETDCFLGTGCSADDQNIKRPKKWSGKNYLGKALVDVRQRLLTAEEQQRGQKKCHQADEENEKKCPLIADISCDLSARDVHQESNQSSTENVCSSSRDELTDETASAPSRTDFEKNPTSTIFSELPSETGSAPVSQQCKPNSSEVEDNEQMQSSAESCERERQSKPVVVEIKFDSGSCETGAAGLERQNESIVERSSETEIAQVEYEGDPSLAEMQSTSESQSDTKTCELEREIDSLAQGIQNMSSADDSNSMPEDTSVSCKHNVVTIDIEAVDTEGVVKPMNPDDFGSSTRAVTMTVTDVPAVSSNLSDEATRPCCIKQKTDEELQQPDEAGHAKVRKAPDVAPVEPTNDVADTNSVAVLDEDVQPSG